MESADVLIDRIVGWARADPRVTAVILTGSRGRAERVDRFSDLDVELIGPHPGDLAADDAWITHAVGQPMVMLPFDEPGLITRLVVLPRGRKIDFSLWPEARIADMAEHGLVDLYDRGFTVLVDEHGLTQRLPLPRRIPATPSGPSQLEFTRLESEFWFEATQVAGYLARADLWVVKSRETTMHECLLAMLEWKAQFDRSAPRFAWHNGHHMHEWLSPADYAAAGEVFTRFDVKDTIRGVTAAMDLFGRVTAEAADSLGLTYRPELAVAARRQVLGIVSSL